MLREQCNQDGGVDRPDARRWRYVWTTSEKNDQRVVMPSPASKFGPHEFELIVTAEVAHEVARCGMETMHAYYLLRTWAARGEEVSPERYLREVWQDEGNDQRLWPLDNLWRAGLLMTGQEREKSARDFAEALYGSRWLPGDPEPPRAKPRRRSKGLTVPDPFPEYLAGRWEGARDRLTVNCPLPGVAVVYHLLDAAAAVVYVGSTDNVSRRLPGHERKPWVAYRAFECPDREAAFWLEARDILEMVPPLNSPHDTVNGRVTALVAAQ